MSALPEAALSIEGPGDHRPTRRPRASALLVLVAAASLVLTGCSAVEQAAEAQDTPVPSADRTLPPAGTGGIDYQLNGAYAPPENVDIVVRRGTEPPATGLYNVCYVNAFQTPPGETEGWTQEGLVLLSGLEPLVDPEQPDSALLDTTSIEQREAIVARVTGDIDVCASAGYDAIELDHLDSYTRSKGLIEARDNLALARALVDYAHQLGLAVAQKNAPVLARSGSEDVGFDFAIVEGCVRNAECDAYRPAYGDRVLAIEYADDLFGGSVESTCAAVGRPRGLVIRDRTLVAQGEPGYVRADCTG